MAEIAVHLSDGIIKKFWKYVKRGDGCWMWVGPITVGYGSFYLCGSRRSVRAHRVSWTIAHGEIPEGLAVCHRCDNPRCVRPDHLFLGTQQDNVSDCIKKGRFMRGERVNHAKLTSDQVREIKKLLRLKQMTIREITKLYPVGYSAITNIKRGDTWAWLKEDE